MDLNDCIKFITIVFSQTPHKIGDNYHWDCDRGNIEASIMCPNEEFNYHVLIDTKYATKKEWKAITKFCVRNHITVKLERG